MLADASADLARELVDADPDATALAYFRRAADVVRERLAYRVGATTVNSSVAEVLAGGSGVCQDFAHVVISLCRHAGLPARYVSGYLGNVAEASASHAWAEAFVPPYGWVGIDATLGHPCTGRHVKVGVGRDYADVAVLRGTYHGGGDGDARGGGQQRVARTASTHVGLRRRTGRRRAAASWRSRTSAPCGSTSAATVPLSPASARAPAAGRRRRPAAAARPAASARTTCPRSSRGSSSRRAAVQLRVGCRFDHETAGEAPAVIMVEPHPDQPAGVVHEAWSTEPPLAASAYTDLYGNRLRRLVLPDGASRFAYDAVLEISPEPEEQPGPDDAQHRIEDLPDELLHWLLPSRYCASPTSSRTGLAAVRLDAAPGGERVQAVCDWIHGNVEYGVPSQPTTTVVDVFERRGGMCRDFAHLGVTFCRALGIPARYTFGYMPDIGIPGPYPPMDFHAWFEVWLGDRWWTFDARFNTPRIGRVPIGRGRDAVDVAMVTTYGAATLRRMTVWADEVEAAPERRAAGGAREWMTRSAT